MANFELIYRNELNNENTRYFILDTHTDGVWEVDFVRYSWERTKYNLVREGDLFIYKKPLRASGIGEFYFFGSGKISEIRDENNGVVGIISSGLLFGKFLTQTDMEDFSWDFKERGNNWAHFFNQYGMTRITREDFVNILNLQERLKISEVSDQDEQHDEEFSQAENNMYQRMQTADYYVPDQVGNTKIRGAAQSVFARAVKVNYRHRCCISGISTTDFLIASHIKPWREDAENRLNPANGLCLSSLLDKAFDKGYIAFDDQYRLVISNFAQEDEVLYNYLINFQSIRIQTYGGNLPNINFIRWHRENIFKVER